MFRVFTGGEPADSILVVIGWQDHFTFWPYYVLVQHLFCLRTIPPLFHLSWTLHTRLDLHESAAKQVLFCSRLQYMLEWNATTPLVYAAHMVPYFGKRVHLSARFGTQMFGLKFDSQN